MLPVLVIVPLSFSAGSFLTFRCRGSLYSGTRELFSSGPWQLSFRNSLVVAIATAILASILGTLAAMGLIALTFRRKVW